MSATLPATEGVERAELCSTLPGAHGLERTVYSFLAHRTHRLRGELYVTVVSEGREFRPKHRFEHFPVAEIVAVQFPDGVLGGERAFGMGGPLEVSFVCYSPPGSGAAEAAVSEIRAGLEKLREVWTWEEGKRSWFGMRHGFAWQQGKAVENAFNPPYRPPAGALPHRDGPPEPLEAPPEPGGSGGVRGHLARWGLAGDWDRMRAEGEAKRAERRAQRRREREHRAQLTAETEWLQRQADPFGRWGGDPWT